MTDEENKLISDKQKSTWFKNGNLNFNHKPIGSIRIRANSIGYEIKIAEPNKWDSVARVLYEYYVQPIPADSTIIHLNGDKYDDSLKTLKLSQKRSCFCLTDLVISQMIQRLPKLE